MKLFTPLLLALAGASLAFGAASLPVPSSQAFPGEQLGREAFAVSCSASVRADFSRGVALLHDFWYEEARPQFERILKADPHCAMAHWGVAMSTFHQIWDRPSDETMALGRRELKAAAAHPAKTAREREYIAALDGFYAPEKLEYQSRINLYSAAMARLYQHYPDDADAGAFYALSLLAAEAPDDTSLTQERKAMAVLNPLFARYPDHPGVVHYIIHACDTPALAADGLAAAKHYGEIAASGPHAVHMPGHIFARLGMWREDIEVNAGSVAASHAAESHHLNGAMDQFHSDDFLLYAYLQTGQDAKAKAVMADAADALGHFESMKDMGANYMAGMFPYYRGKFPVFYDLEMRDWHSAAALEPAQSEYPETQTLTYWARTVADGHLRRPEQARADLAAYDALIAKVRQGRHAYYADSIGAQIGRGEMLAWVAFAEGKAAEAVAQMRTAADLQDKVGQGEVDIPAREMLGDILQESGQPKQALAEYKVALKESPNRFNGLYNAGLAAEASGDKVEAANYYRTLLQSTDNGSASARPEFAHMKAFVTSTQLAVN